jgi:hypothetical protein
MGERVTMTIIRRRGMQGDGGKSQHVLIQAEKPLAYILRMASSTVQNCQLQTSKTVSPPPQGCTGAVLAPSFPKIIEI